MGRIGAGDQLHVAAKYQNFYEEAAISLADTPPSARRAGHGS